MSWSVTLRRLRVMILSAIVMSVATAAAVAQPRVPAITRVAIQSAGPAGSVTVDADGALPPPTAGTLDDPPRIFFDFVGVVPKVPLRTSSSDPRILRVRVALHRASPPTTRIVVDLAAPLPHHVELKPRQLVMHFGPMTAGTDAAPANVPVPAPPPVSSPVSPAPQPRTSTPTTAVPSAAASRPTPAATPPAIGFSIPPVPDLPAGTPPPSTTPIPSVPADPLALSGVRTTPEKPASPPPTASPAARPYRVVGPPPLPRDIEKYKAQAGSLIDRLRLQQPMIESVESPAAPPPDRLQLALNELDRIQKELAAIEPPESVRNQHDLFVQAARLGFMSLTLRMEAAAAPNQSSGRNAAAAAAGAIMTLDRACADVGCPPPPGR